MAIRVVLSAGATSVTAPSLYQWDYGQTLEIEASHLSTAVAEIHFSCLEMDEALVVPCTFLNGVARATIPNECLSQTTAITAWPYVIDGESGYSVGAVKIPVIARQRPNLTDAVPPEVGNIYTELITAVNEVIAALTAGDVVVKQAENANSADKSDKATTADKAISADKAIDATNAEKAQCDEYGNNLYSNYLKCFSTTSYEEVTGTISPGIYSFIVSHTSQPNDIKGSVIVDVSESCQSAIFRVGSVDVFLRFTGNTNDGFVVSVISSETEVHLSNYAIRFMCFLHHPVG